MAANNRKSTRLTLRNGNSKQLWNLDSVFLSSDSSGELHVSHHDRDSLGVDGAEVGVLEEANQVGFRCFLKSEHCLRLESDVVLDVSCQVLHDSLEWQLADEQVGLGLYGGYCLLVPSDFSQSNGTWSVSVGLLDASALLWWGSLLG